MFFSMVCSVLLSAVVPFLTKDKGDEMLFGCWVENQLEVVLKGANGNKMDHTIWKGCEELCVLETRCKY